jgi:hypothetical protein
MAAPFSCAARARSKSVTFWKRSAAQNYNSTGGTRIWSGGDFNNDGVVDFNDLAKLAQNYNTALPGGSIAGAPVGFTADLARAFASVPEPSSVVLPMVVVGGLALGRRRGRKMVGR